MFADRYVERPLFGGPISCTFPIRYVDVSNIREVPDNQEVFAYPARDESLIFELLEFKIDVADHESANWFLQDLGTEQDFEGGRVVEKSGISDAPGFSYRDIPFVLTTSVGQMAVSKGTRKRSSKHRQSKLLSFSHGFLV